MLLIIYQLVNQSIKCPMKKYIMTTCNRSNGDNAIYFTMVVMATGTNITVIPW